MGTRAYHAEHLLSTGQRNLLLVTLSVGGVVLFFWWHTAIISFLTLLITLYTIDVLFQLLLIVKSLQAPELRITASERDSVSNSDWPTYTVLCPLYKEAQILSQFVQALEALDYPKEKLQVLLLLEENDTETRTVIENTRLPPYMSIVIIPDSQPKTKPKALNSALPLVTGQLLVVYDAEDIPDPHQLKTAVIGFKKADTKTVCLQAKLHFYNTSQNILTQLFTAEYFLWFDLILPGLHALGGPIPLGGTSNHFITADLIALGGWDPYNVTEDCDLGIRLSQAGYATAMLDSITYEEANSRPLNWIRQRTRWIKGYLQTYLVHTRNLPPIWQQPLQTLIFHLLVGGKILSMFLNPLMWALTILYILYRSQLGPIIESFFPLPILYLGTICLIFGNFLYFYYYMIACARRKSYITILWCYLVPWYWLAMSMAALRAVIQSVIWPHYWDKTIHGFHLSVPRREKSQSSRNNLLPLNTPYHWSPI